MTLLSLALALLLPVSLGSLLFVGTICRNKQMTTPMTPAVPTLAQLTVQVLVPCLPHIFSSDTSLVFNDASLSSIASPDISQKQLQAGQVLWQELWPDISRDYETVTAVQNVARTPDSPLWRSTFEQGLISILSRNTALAQSLAKKLRAM